MEFNFSQLTGSSSWVITHNLGTPAVAVDVFVNFNGGLEKIIPANIELTSNTVMTVTFSSAQTGIARIVTV